MSLDTQIKALLESDEPITEDELIEETIEEVTDEDQAETTSETESEAPVVSEDKEEEDSDKDDDDDKEEDDADDKDDDDAPSVKEHIDALLSGEELSEEFRTKATTIFEAAVADGVKKQVAQLEEQYNEMLNDAIISVQEELVDKIDGYLGTIVEEWVTENQLAIERGVKADLVEEFIDGLKKLFNDHYVDIPEEKADILDEQVERLESFESQLAEAAQKVAELEEEVVELRKLRNIEMVGEELTDSQFEKFLSLCENVDFESEESFVNKIKTIKESYFPSKATVNESVALNMDTPLLVDEKTSETINAYVKALSSPLTFKK
jgi:uncharacterized coiled-coil protein SlyX